MRLNSTMMKDLAAVKQANVANETDYQTKLSGLPDRTSSAFKANADAKAAYERLLKTIRQKCCD